MMPFDPLNTSLVPAVLFNTGNVFESREAAEMERILSSISEPHNEQRLRAALATDMMGASAEMLQTSGEAEWEARRLRVGEYFRLWERQVCSNSLPTETETIRRRPSALFHPVGTLF